MATAQRVKVLGVLALWLGAMSLSAVTSIGLVRVQLPSPLVSSLHLIGEIMPWARVMLTIALGGWVIARARFDD